MFWFWTVFWLVRWCYCGAKQKEFMSFYFSSFAPVWGWETSLIRVSALSVLEILTSISWLSLFRQFHLFPNGLRGCRIGSKLQHIIPWYKCILHPEFCATRKLQCSSELSLLACGELCVNYISLLSHTCISFLSASATLYPFPP